MAKPLTPQQEIDQLRALIIEAHEVLQDLRYEQRKAAKLTKDLIADLEATANREIQQFANWLQQENNRYATELNNDVDRARTEIVRQLTTSKLILDPVGDHFEVQFHHGRFDDQLPPPHPDQPVKDITP